MFKANQPNSYVPSKSVAIRPEVVSDVGQNQQIRINIPSFTAFLDPNQTFIKCDLEMKDCRGQLVPDPNGGVHSLFRNVLYRDGNNATTLELNEDYNANKSLLNHITQTPSTIHKRELFAGVQNSIGDTGDEQTLYYAQRSVQGGSTATSPDETKRGTNKVEIQTQLNSGIWKQGNILPVSAMNGMRVQIDTEDVLRSCQYVDLLGEFSNKQVVPIIMTTADIAVGAQLRNAQANYAVETNLDLVKNPFAINDILYGSESTGAGQQQLGSIQGFYEATGAKLGITYVPLRANSGGTTVALTQNTSVLFYKMADRQVALDFYLPTDGGGNVKNGRQEAPSYVLSNIEMVCQSVQPPASYVEGLLRASQTEKGVSFDIMSYELYRHNQSNTAGLFQCQIPTLMKRAKSLFSQPLSITGARNLATSSLSGIVDDAQNYEWIWGTNHYPSRLVPLQRYSQEKGTNGTFGSEALHISELQKAVVNVNEPVRNLHLLKDHFCISRSLTKYGQIMDLSTQTLSLRIDYGTGTEQKLFNNYVYGLRRITISRGQVMAE
tara:strand:+ start:644 stop:2293 length:1650 start_codon:yes stop_codon:yes gene_type:complete